MDLKYCSLAVRKESFSLKNCQNYEKKKSPHLYRVFHKVKDHKQLMIAFDHIQLLMGFNHSTNLL